MSRRTKEFEIKFAGAPLDVAALLDAPALRALDARPAGADRLISTYYDDAKSSLAAAGLSLRLRETAAGRLQTVKGEGRSGAVHRFEEERRLAPGEAFPQPPRGKRAARVMAKAGALRPVSRTDIVRRRMALRAGDTRIELCIDIGRAELWRDGACIRSAPLAEVELELVEGRMRDVFRAARMVADAGAGRLHPSAISKAARARALASPSLLPEERAEPLGDDGDVDGDAGAVLEAALRHAALRLMDLIPSVLERRGPEAVHQMRVALRRVRSVIRAYRAAVPGKTLKRLLAGAGDYADALGPAREWDVFLAETLPPIEAHETGDRGFARLRARAEGLGATAWDRAIQEVASPGFSIFVLDLLEAGAAPRWRRKASSAMQGSARAFARRALDARLAAVDLLAADFENASPERRHDMRIALKRLRYSAQTFGPLFPRKRRKGYIKALARLQDDLGAINDAHVAEALAGAAAQGEGRKAARAAGMVCGFHAALADAKAEAAAEDWRAFRSARPFWRRKNKKETHAEDTDHPLP